MSEPKKALDAWFDNGQWFTFKARRIFYRERPGKGRPILLVHGFPTASFDWYEIWDRITPGRRLIALDMLGFGFSDKPSHHRYSIFEQAELHEALCEERGIDVADILAHDYGDTVVQEMLVRMTERSVLGAEGLSISSVCFTNGGLMPEAQQPRPIQNLLKSPVGGLLARVLNRAQFGRSFSRVFAANSQPGEDMLDAYWELVNFNQGARVTHRLIRYLDERRQYRDRWVEGMLKAGVAMRFIDGLDDPVSGAAMVERYRQVVPNPDIVGLDGIGHYPQLEAPDKLLDAYHEFLDNLPAAEPVAEMAGA